MSLKVQLETFFFFFLNCTTHDKLIMTADMMIFLYINKVEIINNQHISNWNDHQQTTFPMNTFKASSKQKLYVILLVVFFFYMYCTLKTQL